jgi:hypothetical protein
LPRTGGRRARPRHRDVLLGQPVQRIQQFHVLEVVRGHDEDLALCESHVCDHTRSHAGGRAQAWPPPGPAFPGNTRGTLIVLGLAIASAGGCAAPALLPGLRPAGPLHPGAGREAELAQRVRQLTQTCTEALDTGASEIRRIERDLHDGAQARLVAMGMTLDAAGQIIDSNPDAARALVFEARDASVKALAELARPGPLIRLSGARHA